MLGESCAQIALMNCANELEACLKERDKDLAEIIPGLENASWFLKENVSYDGKK